MKILITGAAGSVGSGAGEALAARHQIRLSDIVPVEMPYQFYHADVRESGSLDEATKDVDVIILWHM